MDETATAFQAFERHGWNEVAAAYAALTDGMTGQVADALLDAAGVAPGVRVLDLASGPGWTAAAAAARGARVTGLDISTSMVAEARARHPGIAFDVGPGEEMPFDDGSFDAVVSAFGMPHFADHAAVFAEAHRVLAEGGRIAVASWNPPASNPFFAVGIGSIAECGTLDVDLPEAADMFAWADDDVSAELFTVAGFDRPHRETVELRAVTADGPAMVLEMLQNASVRSRALFRAQTDEARAAIAERIVEKLAPMEQDGTWTIPMSAFVLGAARA
jgi:SAM-dependent methyltransferase